MALLSPAELPEIWQPDPQGLLQIFGYEPCDFPTIMFPSSPLLTEIQPRHRCQWRALHIQWEQSLSPRKALSRDYCWSLNLKPQSKPHARPDIPTNHCSLTWRTHFSRTFDAMIPSVCRATQGSVRVPARWVCLLPSHLSLRYGNATPWKSKSTNLQVPY